MDSEWWFNLGEVSRDADGIFCVWGWAEIDHGGFGKGLGWKYDFVQTESRGAKKRVDSRFFHSKKTQIDPASPHILMITNFHIDIKGYLAISSDNFSKDLR